MAKVKLQVYIRITVLLIVSSFAGLSLYACLPLQPGEQLQLPEGLISINSDEGQALLTSSTDGDFRAIDDNFSPQTKMAFCGVATIVTVSLAAEEEGYTPLVRSEADLFASEKAMAIRNQLLITFTGIPLNDLSLLFNAIGVEASVVHADTTNADEFVSEVERAMSDRASFLIVNYSRGVLEQEGTGHISPIGAISSDKKMVLIMDVASHKYPYTWVPVDRLFSAMNTKDGDDFRGYLNVTFK